MFTDHEGQEYRLEHAWNEAPDGRLVDSTAWAFEGDVLPFRYERAASPATSRRAGSRSAAEPAKMLTDIGLKQPEAH